LLLVCERSLSGEADQINEQIIGVELFGRPNGYDSNDDNIVRAHASRLRRKLDEYFKSEGIHEEWRVDIPKGGYRPRFKQIEPSPPKFRDSTGNDRLIAPSLARVPESKPSSDTRNWRFVALIVGAIFALPLIFLCVRPFLRPLKAEGASLDPTIALWSALVSNSRETLIVPGDSGLDLFENVTGRSVSITDYISGKYRNDIHSGSEHEKRLLRRVAERRLTSVVDLDAVALLENLRKVPQQHISHRYARDIQIHDLKSSNAILLGAPEANPWVGLFQDKLDFYITSDQTARIMTVTNRTPERGEESFYYFRPNDNTHNAYALVALVPNLSGTGHVLILQGTTMAGTEAAVEFVTNPNELGYVLNPYISQHHNVPNFQVLLQTRNISGNAPTAKILAIRVHPQ
jgi:hypothetical protein